MGQALSLECDGPGGIGTLVHLGTHSPQRIETDRVREEVQLAFGRDIVGDVVIEGRPELLRVIENTRTSAGNEGGQFSVGLHQSTMPEPRSGRTAPGSVVRRLPQLWGSWRPMVHLRCRDLAQDALRQIPRGIMKMQRGIMKKLLVAVMAGSLLSLVGVPAARADAFIIVNGFAYPPSLGFIQQPCTGAGVEPAFDGRYRAGGVRGTHATGMAFGDTDWMSGVQARLARPTTLQSVSFATLHPAAPTGASPDGYYRVLYDPSSNNFTDNYYVGYWAMNSTVSGWSSWSNLAHAALDWQDRFGAPVEDGVTLAAFADARGGDGSGAYVGFEFGCDGREYFMDDFAITTSASTTTYDFEGIPTAAYLSATPTHHSAGLQRGITRLDLVNGQDHYLLGDAYSQGDGIQPPSYVSGTATLWARPWGRAAFSPVQSLGFRSDTYATFHVRPTRQTEYQVRTGPGAIYEGSVSRTLLVTVARQVGARFAARTVRQGQRIQAKGTVKPTDKGVKVRLQRKVGKRWRNLDATRTRRGGKFVLRTPATSTGRWTVRVSAAAAKGNGGSHTASTRIRVLPRPRPRPQPQPVPHAVPQAVQVPVPVTHVPSDAIKGTVAPHHRTARSAGPAPRRPWDTLPPPQR